MNYQSRFYAGYRHAGAILFASFVVATVALFASPRSSYANYSAKVIYTQASKDTVQEFHDDLSAVLTAASKAPTESVTIQLLEDWNTSEPIMIPQKKHFIFQLDGHMINRGLSPSSANFKGRVFYLSADSVVEIYGGENSSITHAGKKVDDVWKPDANGNIVYTGGVICGGAVTGGGGAFLANSGGRVYLRDVTVAGNYASNNGGAIALDDSKDHVRTGVIDIKNSRIQYNHAEDCGGAVWTCLYKSDINIQEGADISHNLALRGGAVYVKDSDSVDMKLKFTKCKVYDNCAGSQGGAVFVDDNDLPILMDAAEIYENRAHGDGGGIYYNGKDGSVTLTNGSKLSKNKALGGDDGDGDGGGIYTYYNNTAFTLDGASEISGNEAAKDGGGLFLNDISTLTLKGGSKIDGNKAVNGGGVYLDDNDSRVQLFGASSICNNYASNDGGGLYNYDSDNQLIVDEQSTFSGNKAHHNGGAVLAGGDYDFTIRMYRAAKFENNVAETGSGGAIYSVDHELNVSGNGVEGFDRPLFTGNSAPKGSGGAIFYRGDILNVEDLTISNNSSGSQGGGLWCGNTSSKTFYIGGTVVIDGNTAAGKTNNLEMRAGSCTQTASASSSREVTAASKIGFTLADYNGSKHSITGNRAFIKNLKTNDLWKAQMTSDDDRYEVINDSDFLYLQAKPNYTVSAYGADSSNPAKTLSARAGEKVELNTSDFPKSTTLAGKTIAWKLVSWTLEMPDGTKETLTPDSGTARFTMPTGNVIARANYRSAIAGSVVPVDEKDSFDDLTTTTGKSSNSNMTAVQLWRGDGYVAVLPAGADSSNVWVSKRTVKENKNDGYVESKTVTYEVTVAKDMLNGYGMYASDGELAIFRGSASLGTSTAQTDAGSLKADDDGNAVFTFSVTFDNPTPKQEKVTITFDAGEGTLPAGESATREIDKGAAIGELPVPTRTGFEFGGWYRSGDDSRTPVLSTTAFDSNATLKAIWTEEKKEEHCDVSYYVDGALWMTDQVKVGDKVSKPATEPAKEGYEFLGWYTKKGTDWGSEYDFATEVTSADPIELHAKFEKKTFTVTFDANGGVGGAGAQKVKYGEKATEPTGDALPALAGYTLAYWTLDDYYYDFDSPVTSSITLKAVWKPVEYTVKFYIGRKGKNELTETKTVYHGQTVTVPDSVDLPQDDAIALGWCTEQKGGAGTTGTGDAFSFVSTPITSNMTFYLKFEIGVHVYFKDSLSDSDLSGSLFMRPNTTASQPDDPSKDGYTFMGWYTENGESGDDWGTRFDFNTPVSKTTTLYARWAKTLKDITVTIDPANGEKAEKRSLKEGDQIGQLETPTYKGHDFAGWYIEGTDTEVTSTTVFNDDATVVAKWSAKVFSFALMDGDTQIGGGKVKYGSVIDVPEKPTKTGYTFVEWCSDADLAHAYDFDTKVTSDTTLYAKWKIDTYTVKFATGEGATKVDDQKVDFGGCATEPDAPTRKGYSFKGWYADAACEVSYDFADQVTEDMTIYAMWERNSCKVIYMDGNTEYASESVKFEDKASEPEKPTKTGYTFVEWCSDADLAHAYDFDTKVTSDTTLYAKWKIDTYTVKFATGEGATKVDDQKVDFGGCATEPDAPTRKGYSFKGWYADAACEVSYDFTDQVIENKTLYAKWEKLVTVTFDPKNGGKVETRQIEPGAEIGELPSNPSCKGYVFEGWYAGESKVVPETTFSADTTVVAHWSQDGKEVEPDVDPVDPVDPDEPDVDPDVEPTDHDSEAADPSKKSSTKVVTVTTTNELPASGDETIALVALAVMFAAAALAAGVLLSRRAR